METDFAFRAELRIFVSKGEDDSCSWFFSTIR